MLRLLFLFAALAFLAALAPPLFAQPLEDPAPPEVATVPDESPDPKPIPFDAVTYHAPPKPLAEGAVVADWPRFLGPNDDAISPETHLIEEFPEGGPVKVWEMAKREGYTSPSIANGRLVFFDGDGETEVIDCLDPETGERFWTDSYEVSYRDRYGFAPGPRASAVIDSGKVYTLGVTSVLSCLDLRTGTVLWRRRLAEEFPNIATFFFGHGTCPLVHDGKLIVPMGTNGMEKGWSVLAFDQHDGRIVWATEHEWNASYASPIVAELQGKERLLVFQGGESDPAFGGLLCIDPDTGELLDAFPWRPDKYESVNGSTPVAVGGDRVFLTASYQHGATLLRLNEELKWEQLWEAPMFGIHWMTPLALDGVLYGYRGRNEPDAWLTAYDIESGEELWQHDPQWAIPTPSGRDYQTKYFRGSLLHADGRTYALGEFGALGIYELSREGARELDKAQLFVARATWSLPVLHRGLLYISQHEPDMEGNGPRLICYDLRAE